MMGDLPTARISPATAFWRYGVDYVGNFLIKSIKGGGFEPFKVYIALFDCFSKRAVHLESISDLPAKAFIAIQKRFVSRRDKYSDIYNECGTNFVGAKRKFTKFENLAKLNRHNEYVSNSFI